MSVSVTIQAAPAARLTIMTEYDLTGLKLMQEDIHQNAINKGFWEDDEGFATKIALMHSELSEALEAHRTNKGADDHIPSFNNVEVELADCIIRILDTAGGYGLDVVNAMVAKHEFNKTRERKHGKEY